MGCVVAFYINAIFDANVEFAYLCDFGITFRNAKLYYIGKKFAGYWMYSTFRRDYTLFISLISIEIILAPNQHK